MKMILISAKIENFKGILQKEIFFGKNLTEITGDNETGKTTIFDAFSYNLNGKTARGESNFSIKPQFLSEIISPSVELECIINDKPVNFKRVYQAKFAKDKSFKSYETQCFINGIKKSVTDFDNFINNIVTSEIFKLVTNPLHFTEQITTSKGETVIQKQRRILYDMAKIQSDAKLIESNEKYLPLIAALSRYNDISEYLLSIKSEISRTNKYVEEFPVKIQQQSLNFVELDFNVKENDKQLQALQEELQALNKRFQELELNYDINNENVKIQGIQLEIAALKEKNQKHINTQWINKTKLEKEKITKIMQEIQKLTNEKNALNFEHQEKIKKFNSELKDKELEYKHLKNNLKSLREEYELITITKIETITLCSYCQRDFSEEQIKLSNEKIKIEREKKLNSIKIEGENIKSKIELLFSQIETLKLKINKLKIPLESISKLEYKIKNFEDELEKINLNNESNVFENITEYDKNIKILFEKIETVKSKIFDLKVNLKLEKEIIISKIKLIKNQIESCKANQNKINNNLLCQELIDKLEIKKRETNIKLDELQKYKDISQEFIQLKTKLATNKVNSMFQHTKWKLFDFTKEGLIIETCIPVFNEIEYKDLSLSTKIICGLDIIKTFQKQYNTYLPIYIDNTETINFAETFNCQLITCKRIDENCPKCNGKTGRKNIDGLWECIECKHQFKKSLNVKQIN